MNKVTVRQAVQSDLDAVLTLMEALAEFEGYHHHFKVDRHSLAQLITDNRHTGVLVAESPSAVTGILVYFYQPFTYDLKPWLVIKELIVTPHARGQGVGEALFNEAKALCKAVGGSKLKWEVLADNHQAKRFYQRQGGRVEDRWQLMTLTLN